MEGSRRRREQAAWTRVEAGLSELDADLDRAWSPNMSGSGGIGESGTMLRITRLTPVQTI